MPAGAMLPPGAGRERPISRPSFRDAAAMS